MMQRREANGTPMRVVLLTTDLERGGTPLRVARLARELAALGVDVTVGCLARSGAVSSELAEDGVATFACDAASCRDLAALRRLMRHVRAAQPHGLVSFLFHANVAARWVGLRLGVPVLTSTATIEVERAWHLWGERLTAGWDAGHLVNSRTLAVHAACAFGRAAGRIFVVPPSIEPPPPRLDRRAACAHFGVDAGCWTIAWMGRFDPVKRLPLLVDAVAALDGAQLLLAGEGPDRTRIDAAIRRAAAEDRIRLLAWQSNLAPLLSAADCFALPSRTEGVSNALLAAAAFGVPIVASDIPQHREWLGAPPRMELVAGDAAAAYTRAFARLRGDPGRSRRLADAARDWATPFTLPGAGAKATLAVLREVFTFRDDRP